jgi:hypothetical protein
VNLAHDAFERVDVGQESRATIVCDLNHRLRAAAARTPLRRNDRFFGECVQVPIEVAVGERARFLQLRERDATGMRDERRANRQAPSFVKDAIEIGCTHASATRSRATKYPIAI